MNRKPRLEQLLDVSLQLTNVTNDELLSKERTRESSICRGIYLLLAFEFGYKPSQSCKLIKRSRVSCLITTNRYLGYYEVGDKYITNLFLNALKRLRYER
jgi:hypothetical protein